MKSDDNKNLPKIIENSGLALHKTRNLLSITDKILANKTSVTVNQHELFCNLSALMRISFGLGYVEFKENSRFVLGKIREKLGDELANSVHIDDLIGCYISISQGLDGATDKNEVVKFDSIEDIYDFEVLKYKTKFHSVEEFNEYNSQQKVIFDSIFKK
ncbi:MAG: hypothetical protein RL236_1088 [Pseudomonadota bacterium]